MTQRERSLLLIVGTVGGFVVLMIAFFGIKGLLDSLDAKDAQISGMQSEVSNLELKVMLLTKAQSRLEQWRTVSLPPDPGVANFRYKSFLQELCRKHQVYIRQLNEGGGLRSTGARSKDFTPLTFHLQGEATLSRLIGFMQDFYAQNLPHQIRELTLTVLGSGPETRLDVSLRIEALSMPNAVPRDYLVSVPDPRLIGLEVMTAMKHGPAGIALSPWLIGPTGLHGQARLAGHLNPDREYARVITKNIFVGLAPPAPPPSEPERPRADRDILKYVKLTSITANFLTTEATLRNWMTNRHIRLRAEGGFDSFELRDQNDQVVLKGKVKHIDSRDVIFESEGKHYILHIGQFVEEALKKELSSQELQSYGVEVSAAPAENP